MSGEDTCQEGGYLMNRENTLWLTLGLCVRRGIWKTFSPELKPM
jgi:hypothetical protein